MIAALPPWVEDAAALPVAFAQVREDPLLDLWVVAQLAGNSGRGRGVDVAMVASGGCTAAVLAASPMVASLHLTDPNPAQIALTRLKLRLLEHADPDARLALLGHAPMPTAAREAALRTELGALGLDADVLGPMALVAADGPDHAGRYERVFSALRAALGDVSGEIDALLRLDDTTAQSRAVAPSTPLGERLDTALDEVMALPNLVALFGEQATRNPVEPFARHFAGRIRHVLATMPANRLPYLWQMLRGRFAAGGAAACAVPWFELGRPARLPRITWTVGTMTESLAAAPESFDFVHLSNILDWLSPAEAGETLELAWRALRPGGIVLIRQLNSSLDIRGIGSGADRRGVAGDAPSMFAWLEVESAALHARDRSFFYRAIHLGRKR